MYVPKGCEGCPASSKTVIRIGAGAEELFYCQAREWGSTHWINMSDGAECARRVKEEEKIRLSAGIPSP